jgi:ubiquinone/menaquinone biosynthesis C-methylase UbiE
MDGGYADDVRSAWTEFLAILPHGAVILDIGINNHVPALVAADLAISQGRSWRIDAIDPGLEVALERNAHDEARIKRISFHKGEGADRLPFENGSFDAICGHHVLEFTDTTVALAEIHRLLKLDGEAQFTLHHTESPVVASARLSLHEADLVLSQTKAFRRVHRLVSMSQVIPGATERASDEVRAAIRTLKQAWALPWMPYSSCLRPDASIGRRQAAWLSTGRRLIFARRCVGCPNWSRTHATTRACRKSRSRRPRLASARSNAPRNSPATANPWLGSCCCTARDHLAGRSTEHGAGVAAARTRAAAPRAHWRCA